MEVIEGTGSSLIGITELFDGHVAAEKQISAPCGRSDGSRLLSHSSASQLCV